MSESFATPDDYYAFKGQDAPDSLSDEARREMTAELARASDTIRRRLLYARIALNRDGTPKRDDIAKAITRATCAQYDAFQETGDITGAVQYDSVSAAGVTLSRRAGSGGDTGSKSRIAPEAADILAATGMFSTAVAH